LQLRRPWAVKDPASGNRLRLAEIALLLLAAAWIVFWRCCWREIGDDALITMRYAANLARGHGLVYNIGERVLGTTTPLYALILALFVWMGVAPWYAALALDAICICALIAVTYLACRRAWDRTFSALVIGLMLADPFQLLSVGGMETGLFTLLVYSALLLATLGRMTFAMLLAVLACFTRPEGLLVWAIVFARVAYRYKTLQPRPRVTRFWIIALLPLVAFYGALALYYGSPVPQSLLAKHTQTSASASAGALPSFVRQFGYDLFHTFNQRTPWWGATQVVGALIAIWLLPHLRPVFVWAAAYVLFMAVGHAPSQYWYHQPLFPAQCIAVAAFVYALATWVVKQPFVTRVVSKPAIVSAAIALLLLTLLGAERFQLKAQYMMSMARIAPGTLQYGHYRQAAEWIKQRAAPGDEVATPEIGYVGYFSGALIYDCVGLVSPQALRKYRDLDYFTATVRRRSRFMVTRLRTSRLSVLPSEFLAAYHPAWMRIERWWSTCVFERSNHPTLQLVGSADAGTAGVLPRVGGVNYVVSTHRQSVDSSIPLHTAHFRFVGNPGSISGGWYTDHREPLRQSVVRLDSSTSATTTGDRGEFALHPIHDFTNGFDLQLESDTPRAWLVLTLDPVEFPAISPSP
jgi:hypothetical protein